MTPAQAAILLVQLGATHVRTVNGTEWWRLPTGEWLGKRTLPNGAVEVRRFPANACGC